MMGTKELKEDIADFMGYLERQTLPYGVTSKLQKLMNKHNIKRTPCGHGVSA